jgi:hypothetical protein
VLLSVEAPHKPPLVQLVVVLICGGVACLVLGHDLPGSNLITAAVVLCTVKQEVRPS